MFVDQLGITGSFSDGGRFIDAEAAIERELDSAETPDGRDGISVLAFAFVGRGTPAPFDRDLVQAHKALIAAAAWA